MKLLRILFLGIILSSVFVACEEDDINVNELTDFPPGILTLDPADNSKVVIGDFDLLAVFIDGASSPLSSATMVLTDAGGTELGSFTESLAGTQDTMVVSGDQFDAASLTVGFYNLSVTVEDTKGQSQTRDITFEISTLPFAANNDKMYFAGEANGWAASAEGLEGWEFTLEAPNTWVLREVELEGGEFKLKNTIDWSDQDWGDENCDGIMEITTGGGPNTACGYSGLVNITFNDQTLAYTVEPAVTLDQNVTDLYLLGTFNSFQGDEYRFTQTADNTWELEEVLLETGDEFRFSEGPFFMGTNFGDTDGDGIAEMFGENIVFTEETAFYDIVFNDETLEYSVTFNKFPSIGIIGDATPGGWDMDTDLMDNGDGNFSLIITLTDGQVKFRENDSWDVNWGGATGTEADFPSGTAVFNSPNNIPVEAGTYNVKFNRNTLEYSFEPGVESLGIIGDATPGGWDSDTDLMDNGDGTYSTVLGLTDGGVKFRINDSWDVNWGGTDFPSGTGVSNSPDNIPVTAGIYLITFDFNTAEYSFTPASIGLIGDATPTGWDSDTDMTPDPSTPGLVTLDIDLVDGGAKFRVNDDWAFNWGGTGFPSGTAVFNSPDNIPVTAGSYTISFNVNTGAYSFE
jgi:hypothetical protein